MFSVVLWLRITWTDDIWHNIDICSSDSMIWPNVYFRLCLELKWNECGKMKREKKILLRVINIVKPTIWRTRFHMPSLHDCIHQQQAPLLRRCWCLNSDDSVRRHWLHPRWLMHPYIWFRTEIISIPVIMILCKRNHHLNWNSRLVCACAACSLLI